MPDSPPPAAATQTPPKPLPWHKALWKEWIRPIGTVLIIMVLVRSSLVDWNDVPSGSMLPTVQVGDRIFVNKLAYGLHWPMSGPKIGIPFTKWDDKWNNPLFALKPIYWGDGPMRGDIVTFWSPSKGDDNGTRLIKRVVAIPGDRLEVKDGHVWLNGRDTEIQTVSERQPAHWTSPSRVYDTEVIEETENAAGTPKHLTWIDPKVHNLRFTGEIVLGEDEYYCMGDNRDYSGDSRVFGVVTRRQITGRAVGVAFSLNGWIPRWNRFFHGLH